MSLEMKHEAPSWSDFNVGLRNFILGGMETLGGIMISLSFRSRRDWRSSRVEVGRTVRSQVRGDKSSGQNPWGWQRGGKPGSHCPG